MPTFAFVAMTGILLLASFLDLGWGRIPNALTVSAAVLGFTLGLWQAGLHGLGQSLLGMLIGLCLLMPGFLFHFTGGGDVKLMAAVGSFLGPHMILHAFLFYILAGLGWALVYGLYASIVHQAPPPFSRYWAMLRTLLRTGRVAYVRPRHGEAMGHRLPMAPAIAFGAIAAPLLVAAS